jgi:hypothetical protein
MASIVVAIVGQGTCTDTPAQMYQNYLDKSTPYTTYRWIATATVFILFGLRIVFAQGWYIGTSRA